MKQKGISLIGLPGSGKSTIGALLALKLDLPLLDTDVWVEKENRATLRSLYKEHGEEYLLREEERALRENPLERMVVATAGSVVYGEGLELLGDTQIFYLQRPLGEALLERRVLLGKGPLRQMLKDRLSIFEEWANEIVPCSGRREEEIVHDILGRYPEA